MLICPSVFDVKAEVETNNHTTGDCSDLRRHSEHETLYSKGKPIIY